jgi:hypothetical protein
MTTKKPRRPTKLDNRKMIQNIIQRRTRNRFDELEEYVHELERKFDQDLSSLAKRYSSKSTKEELTEEEELQIGEILAEEHHLIEKIFRKNFRESSLLSIYTVIEKSINRLCRYLCNTHEIEITLEDLNGKGIERAQLYLSKVCGIKLPFKSHEWEEVRKLNQIRNCISHAGGAIQDSTSPGKIRNIIKNTKGLNIENDRELIVSQEYLENTVKLARSFFESLYAEAFKDS